MKKILLGTGLAAALVLGTAPLAEAADAPTPTPTASTSAPAPTPTPTTPAVASVLTIKGRTAGTGTNFSGTYRVPGEGGLVAAEGKAVALQRKTPTGWDVVARDTADANGALVYGTVRSNFVQTWRLVADTSTTDAAYAVSPQIKVAQNGKAVSAVSLPSLGYRTGNHVVFDGYFTYRSWWITSGPDTGKQGLAAPLNTRVYLQYKSGSTWKNKTSVLTKDGADADVNAVFDITTQTPKARSWRLYYPGSGTRTSAASRTLTR